MDEMQFLALISSNQGVIYKIANLYRDTRDEREDLFQEIVFQLWKAYPSFRGDAKASTWIYRIALNTAIAIYRKNKPAIQYTPILPDLPAEEPNPEYDLRKERLFSALRLLDDSEKAIITLYLDDFNYKQIAEITGISENYVGVKLNRIKSKIQKLLIK